MPLRVVFAEDNYLVREGVAALLADIDEIDLVRRCRPAVPVQGGRRSSPDAVLTDIRMPPTHSTEGIDAAKLIRADIRRSVLSCCPSTSRTTTPSICSPMVSPGSGTC